MKIIKPYTQIITEQDQLKKIEICGRVCYKSEDKITEDSARKFVQMLIKRDHLSVLEHGSVCLDVDRETYMHLTAKKRLMQIDKPEGSECLDEMHLTHYKHYLVSMNFRTLKFFVTNFVGINDKLPFWLHNLIISPEYDWLFCHNEDCLAYTEQQSGEYAHIVDTRSLTNVEFNIHHRETVRFVVDRGVSHEIVRHRKASFSQESTRYVNYKGDITFIYPMMFEEGDTPFDVWQDAMYDAEQAYVSLLSYGATPQDARSVLPNSVKTEVIMTANVREWQHFLKLRTPVAAHPQMREVAIPLHSDLSTVWYTRKGE